MLPTLSKDGFYHPANEQEVIELVRYARDKGLTIRVRGSGHSISQAVYTDGFPFREADQFSPGLVQNKYAENFDKVDVNNGQIQVMLDLLCGVQFIEEPGQALIAKVQAGCHLAEDPYDPTEQSTYVNSFLYQLDKRGYAVPDTGGITHQTVGGFLSTGSSGGSLTNSIEESIVGFRFIDGNGEVHECSRTDNTDLFNAIGVSVGLLGIITEVTFRPIPRYDITGEEHIRPIADFAGEIDFFGKGPKDLKNFLYETEYTRLLWWPQKGVEKMTVWKASKIAPNQYTNENSKVEDGKRVLVAKPYQELTWVFGSPIFFEYLGSLFYTAVSSWPVWLYTTIKNSWLRMFLQSTIEFLWVKPLLPFLLGNFVETDKKEDGKWQPQRFWDTWWRGLPMDNQIDDRLMPVAFTELWVPMDKTADVMVALKNLFDKKGLVATGTFSTELYATKASTFWLSPAYEMDVFRVDVFLYGKDPGYPGDFYQQYWDVLAPYNFRGHWGKWIPGNPDDPKDMKKWRDYLRAQFPMWDKFVELREKLDPQQVFVNEYWRAVFDIPRLAGREKSKYPIFSPYPQPTVPGKPNVKPNRALLTGKTNNPPTTVPMVLTILAIASVQVVAVERLLSDYLRWVPFANLTTEIVVVSFVCLLAGLGTVFTRYFSPILITIVAVLVVILANVINEWTGEHFWTWIPILHIPKLLFACLCEGVLAVVIPVVTWIIGQKLFPKNWPQANG